jgi:hypothetical protein
MSSCSRPRITSPCLASIAEDAPVPIVDRGLESGTRRERRKRDRGWRRGSFTFDVDR